MKVVKKSEGQTYDAPKHFGVWSIRKLLAGEDTKKVTVAISHFLPGGGVEMSGSPTEKVYYVLDGSMIVKGHSEEYVLEKGDVIYIGPNEERAITVPGTDTCTILVVMATVS